MEPECPSRSPIARNDMAMLKRKSVCSTTWTQDSKERDPISGHCQCKERASDALEYSEPVVLNLPCLVPSHDHRSSTDVPQQNRPTTKSSGSAEDPIISHRFHTRKVASEERR